MTEYFLWGSLILAAYSYLIYPLILVNISAFYQLKHDIKYRLATSEQFADRRAVIESESLPPVTVVLSAYNEEKHIVSRLENLLELDYPQDKLTVLVGCDGCEDNTASLVSTIQDKRVKVFDFSENRGKTSVLNDLLTKVVTPYTVFTDANTYFKKDAVLKLVRHFNDKEVDAVCGELKFTSASENDNEDGYYWKLEKLLKFNESRIGALLGANGAIYAIRTEKFQPLEPDCIVDDFRVVFDISLSGGKVKYDSEAIAIEEEAPSASDEYKRRVRIGAGNYQVFFRTLTRLSLFNPVLVFCYFSHKVVRWFTPHLLLIVLMSNIVLLKEPVYQVLFLVQSAFYILVFFNHKSLWTPGGLLRFPVFLLYMNVALGHGFLRYISGRATASWERTAR